MIQISIFNVVSAQNNILLKKYNKIFANNIHYIYSEKQKLCKIITIANSSINNELVLLHVMQNILKTHPYNYIKLFKNNNYQLPEISYKVSPKKQSSENNIKIFNYQIN